MSLEKTYELVHERMPRAQIDSLDVVRQVEDYRQFWKPEETSVILLAESHVYTDERDFEAECNRSTLHSIIADYPLRFVRFVYCLGYGEDDLLTKGTAKKNSGTPQYWKIFSSCVAEKEDNLGFSRILKTQTSSLASRIRNKVDVLEKMKRRGIWLLDASIIGLYGSGGKDLVTTQNVIEVCWQNHIANVILDSCPKHIIVIGEGVGNLLFYKLHKLNLSFTVIPQPQARGDSEWQLENYRKYQRICAKYA